ncbi:MAG: phage tail protein [Algicola sp.]|nr:phage tail protein [Algicola sp.]
MSTKIVNSGVNHINDRLAFGGDFGANKFILAYVPGLNSANPPPATETIPQGYIVYEQAVTQYGRISADKVVYSLSMDSAVGDFDFNWLGLVRDVDGSKTLIAVSYAPTQRKRKYSGNQIGNNLNRNFVLAFTGAENVTGIHIDAESWQYDLTPTIDSMAVGIMTAQADNIRQSHDIYLIKTALSTAGIAL